jgi:probable F420-dependent oxidoreductase
MTKIVIGLRHTEPHLTGNMPGMIEMVRLADSKGVYGLEISDHLIMTGTANKNYPHGKTQINENTYFYEPLTMLAAYAVVTERIRLSTHVMIAPLRSVIFMAKQVATLDVIAGGRFDLGLGAGWQKQEFDATPGSPFDTRFGHMQEQVLAMRELWRGEPCSFHGKHFSFEDLYAFPLPVQGVNVPVLYGLGPSERNIARMAEATEGWLPPPTICEPDDLAVHVGALRKAFAERGRDPAKIVVGVMPKVIKRAESDPYGDLEATLAQLPALEQAGATQFHLFPFNFGPMSEYEAWLDRIVAAQG